MKEAAQQNDFILAGRLQAQFKDTAQPNKKQKVGTLKYDSTSYNFVDLVNKSINNKNDIELFERDKIQQEILSLCKHGETSPESKKPMSIILWSGRGSGKTSLLRRIATEAEELKTKRDCARLMVFDAADLAEIAEELSTGRVILRVVPALVALHLCKVFGNTTVNGVEFSSEATFPDLWKLDKTLPPSLLAKLEKLRNAAQAYDWWKECTTQFNISLNTASGNDNDPKPIILIDTAEILAVPNEKAKSPVRDRSVKVSTGVPPTPPRTALGHAMGKSPDAPRSHTNNGEKYLILEWLMKSIPVHHVMVVFGTGARRDLPRPSTVQTWTNRADLQPLNTLSENAARQLYLNCKKKDASSPLSEEDLRKIRTAYAVSAGIPRMLTLAFTTDMGYLNGTNNELWEKLVKSQYSDASKFLGCASCLAKAVLISAVCDIPLLLGHKPIPGEVKTWDDLRWDSIAFLTGDIKNSHYTIPRLLWIEQAIANELQEWVMENCKFSFYDLLPTMGSLYAQTGSASSTASGTPWEKMFASTLVARFFAECWMKDMDPKTSYVCLADLLPQQNEDDAKALMEFEVCLCNGIVAGSKEAFASTKIKSDVDLTAVHANWNIKSAHHDMVLPVRCKSSKNNMLFGVSARNGHHKTETDLLKTKQHLVSKEDGSKKFLGSSRQSTHEEGNLQRGR